MSHVHKRLVSRLASVASSSLQAFPPKEALFVRSEVPKPSFNPDAWAAVQPPPSSALSAFAHRIGLASVLDAPEVVQQACTHPSYITLYRHFDPSAQPPPTNAHLTPLGNALMGLFASEYLYARYPHLPTRVLKAAVTAHVGPTTCASVAHEMGATSLLRWHRSPKTATRPAVLHADALSSIPRAITALIYQKHSLPSARQFVHSYFLSRDIDLRSMLKFTNPKKALFETVNKFQRERPKSRLLKETGRFSNSPMFVVGIFSGADQLGEGFGSSLKMAEYRAAEDALHRVFLTRTPDHLIQLPSSTFPMGIGDAFKEGQENEYAAPELAMAEIMYASSGKSKVTRMESTTT